ncbi:MAG: hypothetical protein ACSLE0_16305 [Chitinophagaceae bacterium]
MRFSLLLFFLVPFISPAQINRSANELARENVQEYIISKLFKDINYQPVSYSSLKPLKQDRSEIAWSINHKFQIIDTQFVADKKIAVAKPYLFSFYLDKKLNVISAESFYAQ